MSLAELSVIGKFIERAICPEDVFGKINGIRAESEKELKKQFHSLAKVLHPDACGPDKQCADVAGRLFKMLEEFRAEAMNRIAAGTYGQRIPMPGKEPIIVKGKYVIESLFHAGDIADLHVATIESSSRKPYLLKIARHAADNDLLRAEETISKQLREKLPAKTWRNAVPNVIESFLLSDGPDRRRVNVIEQQVGFVSGEEIRRRIPKGVDGRTIAWMWKRLILMIEWTAKCGFVHGAILPPHILFYPDNDGGLHDDRKHSIRLVDWAYAVEYKKRTRLSAWVPAWSGLYAPEIREKKPLSPQTDLYMGAMAMFYLLGAEITENGKMALDNKNVPANIVGSLTRCIALDPKARPQSVGKYFEEFKTLLEKEYGKPKWWDFNLPAA
jgi:hypothetical protein